MWIVLATSALAEPIAFDAAVREALSNGTSAAIADADRRASLGAARTAGALLENPTAGFEREIDRTRIDGRLPIPIAGQPIERARLGSALRAAANERGDLGRVTAGLEAARAYLEAERTHELAALAGDTRALAVRNRDAATRLGAVSEVSAVDAATLEAQAARAVRDATTAEQDALRARLALEVALGRTPTGEIRPTGWPELSAPEGIDPTALPLVRIATDQAQAANAQRALAAMNLVPTPVVTGGFETEIVRTGPVIGVELEVPLFAPGAGALKTARAQADRAAAELAATQRSALSSWTAAQAELEAARTAWDASRIEGLRPALDAIGQALEAGEYSLTEYTTHRDALVDGLVNAIDARFRLESARLALWELAGRLPPEITP